MLYALFYNFGLILNNMICFLVDNLLDTVFLFGLDYGKLCDGDYLINIIHFCFIRVQLV